MKFGQICESFGPGSPEGSESRKIIGPIAMDSSGKKMTIAEVYIVQYCNAMFACHAHDNIFSNSARLF